MRYPFRKLVMKINKKNANMLIGSFMIINEMSNLPKALPTGIDTRRLVVFDFYMHVINICAMTQAMS